MDESMFRWELMSSCNSYQEIFSHETYRMRVETGWFYITFLPNKTCLQTFVEDTRPLGRKQ